MTTPELEVRYETGIIDHADFRAMARRLAPFDPSQRVVMLPRCDFVALLAYVPRAALTTPTEPGSSA